MSKLQLTDGFTVASTDNGFIFTSDFGYNEITKPEAFKLVQWMLQQHALDPRITSRVKAHRIEGRSGKFKLEYNGEMQDEVVDEANLSTAVQQLVESKAPRTSG